MRKGKIGERRKTTENCSHIFELSLCTTGCHGIHYVAKDGLLSAGASYYALLINTFNVTTKYHV